MADRNEADALFATRRKKQQEEQAEQERREEMSRKKAEMEEAPTTKECPYCKSEISIDATRCPHCTSILEDEAAADNKIESVKA